jgi:[ribosomal protein S5]-alanine N-acetyltransferase
VSYIETERLFLRTWMPQDALALAAIYGDPETMRYIGTGVARSLDETQISLEHMIAAEERDGFSIWPVVRKTDSCIVGTCGLMRTEESGVLELGFAFAPDARGQGYGYESSRAVLDFGFAHLHAMRIVALVHPFNTPSVRLINKLGMRFDRLARVKRAGVGHDLLRYTCDAEEETP